MEAFSCLRSVYTISDFRQKPSLHPKGYLWDECTSPWSTARTTAWVCVSRFIAFLLRALCLQGLCLS